MKIRKDKIEVKVKEEEVKVAEITEEELIELLAVTNGKLLSTAIKSTTMPGTEDQKSAIELATLITDYVAMLTEKVVDIIYYNGDKKEEKE